ncbi:hypothetical protein Barb6XT_00107 [Bacteroidales bacterium Barb6XT]|nr:hypothetical protein Barb6XT_00107 [Bacteroidales bacterium Barb6XT]
MVAEEGTQEMRRIRKQAADAPAETVVQAGEAPAEVATPSQLEMEEPTVLTALEDKIVSPEAGKESERELQLFAL